ncbi:hypothetical protein H2200_002442 [Cladophialophora chaetospira]|uniref:Alpha/beta hydrolase fold-3 domain-containing protein n=1 Tax=Cladophialophora chaetospira TaxID=386627 RepID=A0AA38XJU0_9EURO|nr:hypothetical protein H2200_002442 [Cladophialophora chaetospira]
MARSHDDLSGMNIINPALQRHSAQRPVNLPSSFPDVKTARIKRRAHLDALTHLMPIPDAIPELVDEKEVHVPAADGFKVPVTVYSPKSTGSANREAGLPVIILMHEGGWHLGDRKDEEMNARLFVRDLGCVVLNVEYRLGPEHPFPTGVLDCYNVLQSLCYSAKAFHNLADPSKGIVLGGSSAGGNLAAVLAHKAREDRLNPPVTGQWLSVAALLPEACCPDRYRPEYVSLAENQDDPVIGKMSTKRLGVLLMELQIPEDDPLFTPFAVNLYPPRTFEADGRPPLAKAFIQVAGMDPLRDQSLIYERALREEWGTETRLEIYSGYGHMFWTNWPEMEESKKFWKDMVDGMRWLLAR